MKCYDTCIGWLQTKFFYWLTTLSNVVVRPMKTFLEYEYRGMTTTAGAGGTERVKTIIYKSIELHLKSNQGHLDRLYLLDVLPQECSYSL